MYCPCQPGSQAPLLNQKPCAGHGISGQGVYNTAWTDGLRRLKGLIVPDVPIADEMFRLQWTAACEPYDNRDFLNTDETPLTLVDNSLDTFIYQRPTCRKAQYGQDTDARSRLFTSSWFEEPLLPITSLLSLSYPNTPLACHSPTSEQCSTQTVPLSIQSNMDSGYCGCSSGQ